MELLEHCPRSNFTRFQGKECLIYVSIRDNGQDRCYSISWHGLPLSQDVIAQQSQVTYVMLNVCRHVLPFDVSSASFSPCTRSHLYMIQAQPTWFSLLPIVFIPLLCTLHCSVDSCSPSTIYMKLFCMASKHKSERKPI